MRKRLLMLIVVLAVCAISVGACRRMHRTAVVAVVASGGYVCGVGLILVFGSREPSVSREPWTVLVYALRA
jgi:hypothetical protein